MAATAAFVSPARSGARVRTALVASADGSFRQRLRAVLTDLRWQVREASGGAQAWGEALECLPQTVVVDSWLPDLDLNEFLQEFCAAFPSVDVVTTGRATRLESAPGPHRQEILYALRRIQETDTAAWNAAPILEEADMRQNRKQSAAFDGSVEYRKPSLDKPNVPGNIESRNAVELHPQHGHSERITELIGDSPVMLEVSRRIRLVASRRTAVLIEGPTGSGKELVAEALHRLSSRNRKSFVAINCAAIPEALLEAELFGHTRGAFTGAVQRRVGRIEAADGGTLFLDEIGEMPLSLQSKLLRFVESGELQRVGDNETVKVDVRIIAATHQPLGQLTQAGGFRADLYYRLAVFLIRTPPLSEHLEDLAVLITHFLDRLGRSTPLKRIDETAMKKLRSHSWPGNVRELEHVLERAVILAGDETVLTDGDIDFGTAMSETGDC